MSAVTPLDVRRQEVERPRPVPVPSPAAPEPGETARAERRSRRRRRRGRGASSDRVIGFGIAIGLAVATFVAAPAFGAEIAGAEIAGVHFAERVDVGQTPMVLQGAGLLRYRVVFKGYAAALYVDERVAADDDAQLTGQPRRLEIEYFWSIPKDRFAQATRDGVSRNVSAGRYSAIEGDVERLNELYRDVQPGDRYALTYLPGSGVELSLNGESLGRVPGSDFADAIFAIWLGDVPLDAGLKQALLGGREDV